VGGRCGQAKAAGRDEGEEELLRKGVGHEYVAGLMC
jgi:hypothetical protein